MTKMDFSGVADARVGEAEVQRIYRGETKVWNKYCWEKWSCGRETWTRIAKERVDSGWINMYTAPVTCCASYTASDTLGCITLKGACSPSKYTYIHQVYDDGYSYIGNEGDRFFVGDIVRAYTNYGKNDAGYTVLKWVDYEIVRERTYGDYYKGSTSYGIVQGNAGDYPDNGRHSDGYWYVRTAPVGVKEG